MDISTCQGAAMPASFWTDFCTTLNALPDSYTEIAFAVPGGSEFNHASYHTALTPEMLQKLGDGVRSVSFLNGCKKRFLLVQPGAVMKRMAKNSMIFEKNILSFDVDCKDFIPNWLLLSAEEKQKQSQILAPMLLELSKYQLPVWFLLYSGNGFHIHFKCNTPIVTKDYHRFYLSVLGYLSCLLDLPLDKNCCNASRLMRLPFSSNWKDAKAPVATQVFGYNPEANAEDFLRKFHTKTLLPEVKFTGEKHKLHKMLSLKGIFSFFGYDKWASWKEATDTILCSGPFSEDKTPSFYFDKSKRLYFDFSRSRGGDLFTLIAEFAQLDCKQDFKAVLQYARKILGIAEELPSAALPQNGSYQLKDSGVWYHSTSPDEQTNEIWICSYLEVLGYTRDPRGYNWGRWLRMKDADGTEKTWAMAMEHLAGEGFDLRKKLFQLGVELNMSKYARQHLAQYLLSTTPPTRLRSVSRIGWMDEAFLLPDRVYSREAYEAVVFQSEQENLPYKQAGTLSQWRQEIARYCEGNSRLILALCAAFAPPLLHLTGEENFGLHLVGASSIGKTIALMVAGSVWGKASLRGYGSSWRSTLNGLEGLAAQHHDALLVLDELAELSSAEAGNAAYMLANGAGKVRGSKEGGTREAETWRLVFLSAGEIDLATHMAAAGETPHAGQEIRMISIDADAGAGMGLIEALHDMESSADLVRHVREQSLLQYGTPIRNFLEGLVQDPDIASKYQDSLQRFKAQLSVKTLSGQQIRVMYRFHLLAFAGELACAYGVMPFSGMDTVLVQFYEDWLRQYAMGPDLESHRVLLQVRSFLQRYGATHFPELTDGAAIVHKCFGFRKKMPQGEYDWLIPTEIFREEICAGYELRRVISALKNGGYLAAGDQKSSQFVRLPNMGRIRVYQIQSKIMLE